MKEERAVRLDNYHLHAELPYPVKKSVREAVLWAILDQLEHLRWLEATLGSQLR